VVASIPVFLCGIWKDFVMTKTTRTIEIERFGALWRFGVDRLPRRDLAGSPRALERRLIAFPKAQDKALYRVEPAHRK